MDYLFLILTNRIYFSYYPAACKAIPDFVQGMAKPAVDMARTITYSHHCSSMADNNNQEKREDEEMEEKGDTETEDNGVETEDEAELLTEGDERVNEEIERARRSVESLDVSGMFCTYGAARAIASNLLLRVYEVHQCDQLDNIFSSFSIRLAPKFDFSNIDNSESTGCESPGEGGKRKKDQRSAQQRLSSGGWKNTGKNWWRGE